jgi:formylglycine-generating enzyme required for sulfatase activity
MSHDGHGVAKGEHEGHMAVLFVSHSSKDDGAVMALEAWLSANGFTDIFVDHHSIAGGDAWGEALQAAAGTCRVVVCLVTENWLASLECFGEFQASFYMGKRIIPLFLLPAGCIRGEEAEKRLAKVCAHYQGLDVLTCLGPDGVLDLGANRDVADRLNAGLREAGALSRVGLDPETFAVDRKLRPMPFPGLASFGDDDADAALFYGRSREIAEALEELRKVRAERDLRPFVILGASGAGKSSLLKAGIVPRLRREAPAWLPLRAFRPGADPLLNFAEALARSLADFGKVEAHGVIRDRLLNAWSKSERNGGHELTLTGRTALEGALEAEGCRLRDAADRPDASILVSVDQAEEMARADGDSGEALADYLRVALASATSRWQLAFTIRTDSFPELQSHRRFQDLKARAYDLRAIPAFRFDSVVEEPAKRYGVEVDNALVDALMEDAPKEDALPLLAFALQRLWRQYAASGTLTKDNYDGVGGLRGLIEDAAERALRGLGPEEEVALPTGPPSKRRADLAASTFVPALAEINDRGATIRRIAAWKSFNDEQQDLLIRFDQWRLVVRKGDTDSGTVEVAHEALFREWARLKGWLEPERARLEALRSLQIDALTWDRNGRDAAFLNHRDKRLAEATTLAGIEGYRKRLGVVELDYLVVCQGTERIVRRRARRVQALICVLLVGIIVALVGWMNQAYLYESWRWFATVRPYLAASVRPYVLTAEAEHDLKPLGKTFKECAKDCPEMVVIPAGTFVMGSPIESGRRENEGPPHDVVFARPFAVSRFDVTFDDWDACAAYGDCDPRVSDGGFGRGRQPVYNITWDDAKRYAAWLSRMTGKPYRLLTEAEWEFAARAGTKTAYSFGDDEAMLGQYAWYNANSGRRPHPVGEKKPNAFGLYDMHGNVYQWVEDCIHENYNGAPVDGSAWTLGAIATAASFAVVPGTSVRGTSARPPAAGSPPTSGATFWASGSGGRLLLESLPL